MYKIYADVQIKNVDYLLTVDMQGVPKVASRYTQTLVFSL